MATPSVLTVKILSGIQVPQQLAGMFFLCELHIFAVTLSLWMLILKVLQKYSLSHCLLQKALN